MFNRYLFKLSLSNIKYNKKIYRPIFLAIMVSFLIASLANVLSPSFQRITYLKRAAIYGGWDSVILNASNKEIEKLKDYQDIEIGISYVGGYIENNHGYIGSYDSHVKDYAYLQFNEGNYPKSHNEIAISDKIADIYHKKIYETLQISFQDNQSHTIIKQYKIVGIYKDYELSRECRFLSAIVSDKLDNSEKDIYIKTNHREELWNQLSNDNDIQKKINNVNIIGQTNASFTQINSIEYTVHDDTQTYYTEITIITLAAILATMLSSFEKRKQSLVLFRCIGLTRSQVNLMIIFEILAISMISSLIGMLLGFSLAYFILLKYCQYVFYELVYIFDMNILIKQYLYCYFTLLVSILIMMIKVYDISLVGNISDKTIHIKPILNSKKFIKTFTITKILKQKSLTILLCILSIFIIFRGTYLSSILHDFIPEIKEEQKITSYNIKLSSSAGIQNKDIEPLRNLNHSSLTCYRTQEVYVYWQGIEKYEDYHVLSDYQKTVSKFELLCLDEDKDEYDHIQKSLIQGRMPIKQNEVVLIKPTDDQIINNINEIDILINDKTKRVKVVGMAISDSYSILTCGILINTESYLDCLNNQYHFLSIKGTLEDAERAKRAMINIESQDSSIQIDTNLYEIEDSNINITDLIISECIYDIILLILIFDLIFLIREIQMNAQLKEYQLYKSIGMTDIQLLKVEILYLSIIYWISALLLIIIWSIYVFFDPFTLIANLLPSMCILYFIYLLITLKPFHDFRKMR